MRNRALVFIESNTSGTGRLFVQTARAMGFRPVLVTARPQRYSYLSQYGAPEVIVVPAIDEDAVERQICDRFGGGRDVAGITSSSEYFIGVAAALAARFGLPGPDATRVRASRDKSWQREVLAAHGLPTPAFRVVGSPFDVVSAAREIGLPVVVKPLTGSGSVGVRACTDAVEAGRHAATLLAQQSVHESQAVLVEALIDGPEFSVEVFSGRVIGITRKHLGTPPYFVETGHDYPAPITADRARMLTNVVTQATALLGLGWGPLHWELRLCGGRAFPMEVNPRLAGGFIPELVRYAHGINLIRETLRLVVGEAAELRPSRDRSASIRFLLAPQAGRFIAAGGLDEARAIDHVLEVALYCRIGDELSAHGDFRDRVGHVMSCAADARVAASAASRAQELVDIRVAEPALNSMGDVGLQ